MSASSVHSAVLEVLAKSPWRDRKTIAKETGYSPIVVYKGLKNLEESGEIKYRKHRIGKGTRHEYALIDAPDEHLVLADAQEKILDMLRSCGWLTRAEIAEKTGWGRYKVYGDLKKIEQAGLIKHRQGHNGKRFCYYYALVHTSDNGVPDLSKKTNSTIGNTRSYNQKLLLAALEQSPFLTRHQVAERVNWSLERTAIQLQALRKQNHVELISLKKRAVYCTAEQYRLLCLLYRARIWVPVRSVEISISVLRLWSQPEVGYVALENRGNNQYVQITAKGVVHASNLEKRMDPAMLPLVRNFLS